MLQLITLALASTLFFSPADPSAADDAAVKAQLPTYPMATCVISGEPLGDDAVNVVAEGHLVRTCCNDCARKVKAAPAEYVAKVDRAVVSQQAAHYPMKTCIKNTSEVLTGEAVDTVVGTRMVRTCCKRCAGAVAAEPAVYMERLDAAYIAQQLPTYAVEVCVVSGEELGDDTIDMLYGNTLVRLCCKGCKRDFAKDPTAFMRKVAMASKAHGKAKSPERGEAHGRGDGHGHDDHDGDDHDDHDGRDG